MIVIIIFTINELRLLSKQSVSIEEATNVIAMLIVSQLATVLCYLIITIQKLKLWH